MGLNNLFNLSNLSEEVKLIPFTLEDVNNKELIIKMLKYEDEIGKSDKVQDFYRTELLQPRNTLEAIYATHRLVLNYFGFDTTDESVLNYRKIFSTYYKSPTEYDNDVISSVYYMKNNRCVFYNKPMPKIGNKMINTDLLKLDGTKTNLFDILSKFKYKYCFVGAFSNS